MNPADFAGLVDMMHKRSVKIVNLKQEVVGLHQQFTALQQAHRELAAATPLSTEAVQFLSSPKISTKISFPDKWNGIDGKCEVFLTNLTGL